jgi:hypothetical protein
LEHFFTTDVWSTVLLEKKKYRLSFRHDKLWLPKFDLQERKVPENKINTSTL